MTEGGGMSDVAYCRSCGDPIIWLETTNGRKMPVNVLPDLKGNVEVYEPPGTSFPKAIVHPFSNLPADDRPLYVSHFATCPEAKKHRRR